MPVNKKYTHIFFDLDNTLWDFEKNSRFAMEATFNQFKLKEQNIEFHDFFKIYSEHNHNLWTAYRNKEVIKKELIRKRFQLAFDALCINGISPEEMNERYLNEMPKQKFLNEGATDVLKYLKSKRYKLFIITNGFKEVQYKKLKSSGLLQFFEKVFISEEVKTPKPGREIFEYSIKSANAKKSASLMIGDDWDVDILGASNFGIDSVYYSPSKVSDSNAIQMETRTNCKIYKMLNLRDLASILEEGDCLSNIC